MIRVSITLPETAVRFIQNHPLSQTALAEKATKALHLIQQTKQTLAATPETTDATSSLEAALQTLDSADKEALEELVEGFRTSVAQVATLAEVKKDLQTAIRLEHSTLPPYLFALYSLKDPNDPENEHQADPAAIEKYDTIRDVVFSVAREEMLHMSLACNILNSIGGNPQIPPDPADKSDTFPHYPGHLPGGVEQDLIVPLKPLSSELIRDVFMRIEQPEHPWESWLRIIANVANTDGADASQEVTIGAFYTLLLDKLTFVENAHQLMYKKSIFQDRNQVASPHFFPDHLIKITDLDSARLAIHTIIDQGEGTSQDPYDIDQVPAHYYRFMQLTKGAKLTQTATGFEWVSDSNYVIDPSEVYNLLANPTLSYYTTLIAQDPTNYQYLRARELFNTFNYTYSSMLNALQLTFNGQPHQLRTSIGAMESMKQMMKDMADIQLPGGVCAAPSFEYTPFNPPLEQLQAAEQQN